MVELLRKDDQSAMLLSFKNSVNDKKNDIAESCHYKKLSQNIINEIKGSKFLSDLTTTFSIDPPISQTKSAMLGIKIYQANKPQKSIENSKEHFKNIHRASPVKRRKLHISNGHFLQHHRFYQVVQCAYCRDFMYRSTGYRCIGICK